MIAQIEVHDQAREREHRTAANRAVTVSAIGLALTGGIELAVALLTGSVALLGDALHNLSDVSTSLVVFLGFWISKKEPSKTHPYGYERAQDIAGLGVAVVIFASAIFAGYQSYEKLIANTATTNVAVGMFAAVIGMLGNLAVSRYKANVARQINSVTMAAERPTTRGWTLCLHSGHWSGSLALRLATHGPTRSRASRLCFSFSTSVGR